MGVLSFVRTNASTYSVGILQYIRSDGKVIVQMYVFHWGLLLYFASAINYTQQVHMVNNHADGVQLTSDIWPIVLTYDKH